MTELLRAEHLEKIFPVKRGMLHAVSDVSLTIRKGETLGLVGESGCGKSTLGKLLMNLIPLTSGEVFFRGKSFTRLSGRELLQARRGIQMIFQDPYASLDPRMSIGRIIMEPLRAHHIGGSYRQRVEMVRELMEKVGIRPEHFSRYPHQFSGGQRQRVGIARALALNPELVICDEPVSALDVSIQAQVLNLLRDLQEQMRLTYLFISHDLDVVRYLSDRVCVMFLGQICEMSPTEPLYRHPLHPYTRFLTQAVSKPDPTQRDEARALLTGDVASPINPPACCRFHPRCPYATGICAQQTPALLELAPGRYCACHHPLE